MNRPEWCSLAALTIERDGSEVAALFDEESNLMGTVPASWTDKEIRLCVSLCNKAYGHGYEFGQHMKASEIRRALGVQG